MTQPARPESYESEVIEAIERALESPLELSFDEPKTATHVSQRIYGAIKALQNSNHPLAGPASGLMVKRPGGNKGSVLIICRREHQPMAKALRAALDAAGTSSPEVKVPEKGKSVEDLI